MTATAYHGIDPQEYRRRIRAWTLYDWANSAFATTILAAVLPIYYSQVAGGTLPSPAIATAYWSRGLSIGILIVALISPILGTISDIMRGKKRFLAVFAGIGIVSTGLLVLVETGDWMLASILFVLGRIGFSGANVFYDALLPHVAREEDQDRVSTRGYAMGYLGGGILLAINVVMIQFLPGTWGPRLSFLSVAIWWAIFSIPIFLRVPEPPAATMKLSAGENVISASFKRLRDTLRDISQYRELFKYLLAFILYVDGIGTIIGVAAIYGAELGFDSVSLILALLLVQFVGIPFSLIFGSLPSRNEKRRPFYLSFVVFNMIALPLVGIAGARFLSADIIGSLPAPYEGTAQSVGQGFYLADDPNISYTGTWESTTISAEISGEQEAIYLVTSESGAAYALPFNGRNLTLLFSTGPDHGIWSVVLDGQPLLDMESGEPVKIDGYNPTIRYEVSETVVVDSPGEHVLSLINTGEQNPSSQGTVMSVAEIEVLPPERESNLGLIFGLIFVVELVILLFAWLLGRPLFRNLAEKMNTKNSILLSLLVYTVIAIWGYFLNSVIEFWFLAMMVAVVQGGSQALSRSLFASMSPAAKSGEFFGLFGIMEKFSTILGPLVFAYAATTFGSSRPAILTLIAFFAVGGYLLTRVNVEEGRRVAQAEDALLLGVEQTN
ncbi:MAG: MFS transporter [Chloroflexota bacterium]|nr:MAG: MFS transporter [Chloroflexota bacterium]